MTDHDDTPSTDERERARRELRDEYPEGTWAEIAVYTRVRANRLAARVAEIDAKRWEWRERCDAANAALLACQAELAKLRAAAAPVELPGDWVVTSEVAQSREAAVSVILLDGYISIAKGNTGVGIPASVLRHLLALPPQEDVRGALPEHVSGALVFIYDMFIAADPPDALSKRESDRLVDCAIVLAEHVRGTAPRTEGGGDHGE